MGSVHSRVEEDEIPKIMKTAIEKIENKVPFNETEEMILTKDSIVNSIIGQFAERSRVGYEKYGTTLDREDLSLLDWVQHAQEEMMDGILYLEKIKRTISEKNELKKGG